VFNLSVAEIILNEPGIRALIGKGEAAGMAQHVGMGGEGQGSGTAGFLQKIVERYNGLRCSLINNVLTVAGAFMWSRTFSHALISRISSVRSGCVVDNPRFSRFTCNHGFQCPHDRGAGNRFQKPGIHAGR
jgi:hypothetical protein